MSCIFLLEDDLEQIEITKKNLEVIAGSPVEFQVAQNREEAIALLEGKVVGELGPLIFDLLVPKDRTGTLDYEKDWIHGLTVVKRAWDLGHRNDLIVISAYADDQPTISSKRILERNGIRIEKWLSKEKDLVTLEDWQIHFGSWFEDLNPLRTWLREKCGLLTVDQRQVKTLRALSQRIRASLDFEGPALPTFLLTGPAGAGKSKLAECMPWIKRFLLGERERSIPFHAESLASMGDTFTDSNKKTLFGVREWPSEGKVLYDDGLLMRATCYGRRSGRKLQRNAKISQIDPRELEVDRRFSGYCLLDEVLHACPAVHDSLLVALERGEVRLTGLANDAYPVGCGVVFATNLDVERAVVGGERAEARGQVGDAFRSRLGAPIPVVGVEEWAFGSVLRLLEELGKPVAGSGQAYLEEMHGAGRLDVRQIHRMASTTRGRRLTEDQLRSLLPRHALPVAVGFGGAQDHQAGKLPSEDAPERQSAGRPSAAALGLPSVVSSEDLFRGPETWLRVRETRGACIANDVLKAVDLLNVSPGTVLVMLVAGFASIASEEVERSELEEWLGAGGSNPLSSKINALSKKFSSVFVGRTKGESAKVGLTDLQFWAESWNRQMDVGVEEP